MWYDPTSSVYGLGEAGNEKRNLKSESPCGKNGVDHDSVSSPLRMVEWLDPFKTDEFGYDAFFDTIGSIILGRLTYKQIRGFGDWPYTGKRCIVLSSQAIDTPPHGVEHWNRPLNDLVSNLKTQRGGEIWIVGGAKTIGEFFDLDAVDEIELFVMPVLLGSGIPLFGYSQNSLQLRLNETRSYPSGVVKLVYSTL